MVNSKSLYIDFCKYEPLIPIFSQPWWLDAVCGEENWNVILVEKGDSIVASFPYYVLNGKFLGTKNICMPLLTQKLGPYIKYPEGQKYTSKLSYEKEIMQEIINKLPKYDFFYVQFDYKYTNWLPFYWNGFQQTTRYTYVIEDISDIDKVVAKFDSKKRAHLRKGEKNITIKYDLSAEEFITYYQNCLGKSNHTLLYSANFFCALCKAAYKNKQGQIVYAVDQENHIHGAIFYIWDNIAAYDLVTAFDPEYKNSGASTYLVYQLIKDSLGKCNVFDFEGSMIENVEESFRKFGTIQKSYFQIYKYNSRRYRIIHAIKSLINAIKN